MNDRLRGAFAEIVRGLTRAVDFHRAVRARVDHVHASGRVDTSPETVGTPTQTDLPLRFGVPGVLRAVAGTGARVLLAWAEGDPSQPYVAAWDGGESLEELTFNVPGGARHLGRSGDTTDNGTLVVAGPAAPVPGIVLRWVPPGVPTVIVAGAELGIPLSGTLTGTSRIRA